MNVYVVYWRFESGEPKPVPESLRKLYTSGYQEVPPRGWYCWAYPSDDREFEQWMSKHCPTAEITHRFNSGDPMYTVMITDDQQAEIFEQTWVKR